MGALRVDGVVGRLGGAPELRFTPSGAAVASVSIVFQESYKNQSGEWVDKDPVWVNATAWRELAENMAEGFGKGDEVIVSGVLSLRQYDKRDGGQGTSLDLNVSQIGPTMRRQKVAVRRITREHAGEGPAASGPADPWDQPQESRSSSQPQRGPGQAQTGQWSNGQPVQNRQQPTPQNYPQGGFADEPPF